MSGRHPARTLAALCVAAGLLAPIAPAAASPTPGDLAGQVLRSNLESHIAALEGERASPEGGSAASAYVRSQLESYGYAVIDDPVRFGRQLVSENLIATRMGTVTPERILLVGAHFDTVPGSPGADDNASGVAALLEMARIASLQQFESSVQFVAFALEEPGLFGSRQLARSARASGQELLGMLSLEMIGYTCDELLCQFPPFIDQLPCFGVSTPGLLVGDFIGVLANTASSHLIDVFAEAAAEHAPGLRVEWGVVEGDGRCLPDSRRSDHAPFWDEGLPAIMITDTANFRNPNYHEPADTLATLDLGFATDVTRAALATVARIAVLDPRPAPKRPTGIGVAKSAAFDGRFVSGSIRITNEGEHAALIAGIEDTLEVHAPRSEVETTGSTPNWQTLSGVPVSPPALLVVPVGQSVELPYELDLCQLRDAEALEGATLRNVVAVTLDNKPRRARATVVTRSGAFQTTAPECPVDAPGELEDLSPCRSRDAWRFSVSLGQSVAVRADTVATATAADLCFSASCGFAGGAFADDDFPCTYPPPFFSCPEAGFVAGTDAVCSLQIRTCSTFCADRTRADYSVSVQADGFGVPLTLVGDDF